MTRCLGYYFFWQPMEIHRNDITSSIFIQTKKQSSIRGVFLLLIKGTLMNKCSPLILLFKYTFKRTFNTQRSRTRINVFTPFDAQKTAGFDTRRPRDMYPFMDHKDTSKTQRTSQTIKRLQVSISELRWPGSTHYTHFPGDGVVAGSQRQLAIPLRGGS